MAAGTSAAAPLIASLITLLNNDRLNAGKTPLGFVNQVMYNMFYKNPTQYYNNQFNPQTNGGECGTNFGYHSK
jgi:tripeptidyl-peptidase-1